MVKVLVVDDDYLEGTVMRLLLEKERPVVRAFCYARNGRLALEIAHSMQPHIAFVDIQMPGLNGIETIEQLKLLNPNIKISMISAYEDSDYVLKAVKAGASDYILKPARPSEFLRVFDKLLKLVTSDTNQSPRNSIKELVLKILSGERSQAIELLDIIWKEIVGLTEGNPEELRIRSRELSTIVIHSIIDWHHSPEPLILLQNSLVRLISTAPPQTNYQTYLIEMVETCIKLLDQYANDAGHELVSKACDYIQKNIHKNITLDDVARQIHLSTYYFSRLFKGKTGVNYSDYLIQLRLEKAKILLLTTNDTVAVIAKKVGYCETNSFSRLFKSRLGVNPSQYRQQGKVSTK